MIRLPGLIDPHVHLREPGAIYKEDFDSGTAAALAGGFTIVLAMPNTKPPLIDEGSLALAQKAARAKARCDYGLYLGAGHENRTSAAALAQQVCGMKLYLDQTYGPLRIDDLGLLRDHIAHWPAQRALAAHAEGRSLAAVIFLAALEDRPIHVCHVSRKAEILLIKQAKQRGIAITCEVSPHHLFLTEDDLPRLGPGRGEVRPSLATYEDQQALWDNLDVIDCFASDHAPHTAAEKDGPNPPPGFPGLETTLGLMLTAVRDGRLTIEQCIERMYTNPHRIFGLPEQPETWVEIDPDAEWEVQAEKFFTGCDWTPYEGMRLRGRVTRVILRGKIVFQEGKFLEGLGYGQDVAPAFQNVGTV